MSPKNEFWAEKQHFRPQKRPLWAIGAIKRSAEPPNGHLPETKCIKSCLRIWGRYDPIESGPSEPKKWGLYGCSVKKSRFWGQKCSFLARNCFFGDIVQIVCYHHDSTPKRQRFCVDCFARRASGRTPGPIFGPKICKNLHFFTLHPHNPHPLGPDGSDSMGQHLTHILRQLWILPASR